MNYIRGNVQRKATFCTLLYLCTVHISPKTFRFLTYIENSEAISVFIINIFHFDSYCLVNLFDFGLFLSYFWCTLPHPIFFHKNFGLISVI